MTGIFGLYGTSLGDIQYPLSPLQVIVEELAADSSDSAAVVRHPLSVGSLQDGENLRIGLEKSISGNLRNELYMGSRAMHSQALGNEFLQNLTGGIICPQGYNKYLSNLYVIHQALEEAQGIIKDIEGASHFIFTELWRSQAIAKDREVWKHIDKEYEPAEASRKYALQLVERAKTEPEEILGAMYSFYGTLFHGGQHIKDNAFKAFKTYRCQLKEKDSVPEEIFDDANDTLGIELFSFAFDNINDFKVQTWHTHLNDLPEKTGCSLSELSPKMIKGANEAIEAVLAFIEEAGC